MLYPNYSLDQLQEIDDAKLFAVICTECWSIQLVIKRRMRDWIAYHRKHRGCTTRRFEKRALAEA